LYYYGARYYDPQIGLFLSADTLVPDAGVLFDYNRYMYFRGGYKEQGVASGSEGNEDFWNACEQTLLHAGYDPEKHGKILRLRNTQGDIADAIAAILAQEQADSSLPVIIVGHSWGAAAGLETAQLLDPSIYSNTADPTALAQQTATVDLLFLIDAELGARWMKRSIPGNVETAVNLHAQNIYPDQWWNLQNGIDHFEGAENITAPAWVNFGRGGFFGWHRVGHNNLTTTTDYQDRAVANPVTFSLVADYTVHTLFGYPSLVEP
jgi:hypothetical protein